MQLGEILHRMHSCVELFLRLLACKELMQTPHGLTVAVTGLSRELGSASTWSLDRLDALAAEASALFKQRAWLGMPPRELKSQAVDLQPKPSRKGSLSSILHSRQPLGTAKAMVRSSRGTEARKERAVGETASTQSSSRRRVRSSRRKGAARQGSADSSADQAAALEAKPPLMPKPAKQQRASTGKERDQRPSATAGNRESDGTSQASSASAQAMRLSDAESPVIRDGSAASCSLGDVSVCQFPMHALTAINDVLFGRHGYRRMALHGDPRQVPPSSAVALIQALFFCEASHRPLVLALDGAISEVEHRQH